MKTISQVGGAPARGASGSGSAVDTTFVLFFLAIEFGQTFRAMSLDGAVLAITLSVVIVAPYFLLGDEKPDLSGWVFGRVLIAGFAFVLGVMFKQSLGSVLPEMFRFLPLTLLIASAMLSCYIQFYSFLRLRFVK